MTHANEVHGLVGSIVLATQEAEHYLKVILPFADSRDTSLSAIVARGQKLRKRMLGQLIGQFGEAATSTDPDFQAHLAKLVDDRNRIVHQFNETYGEQLRSGDVEQVLGSLRVVLFNVTTFRDMLAHTFLNLVEAMRDTTFKGTDEYEELNRACLAFRASIAANG